MQHASQAGATCTSHTAPAHPVPHAPGRHRAATWLRHIVCLDACILPLGRPRHAVHDERRRIVQRSPRGACRAQAYRAAYAARAPLCSIPSPGGVAPSPTIRQAYSHAPLRPHAAVHRTPLAASCVRRTVRAIHRPCRTAQHTIPRRADAQVALGTRTALLFEIEPPLNVTAPSDMSTTPPPYCAQPTQPCPPQSALHPVRPHPLH